MKYKKFKEIVEVLRDTADRDRKFNELGLNVIEFIAPYQNIIDTLLGEILTEEQQDWFDWFCWENDFGRGGLEAWGELPTHARGDGLGFRSQHSS